MNVPSSALHPMAASIITSANGTPAPDASRIEPTDPEHSTTIMARPRPGPYIM
jgi:hypothetical protein